MEPSTATSYNGWFYNNQNVANGFAYERSQWNWSFMPGTMSPPKSGVFEILAAPVPEPAGVWIGLLGTGYIWLWRRSRSTSYDDSSVKG
jgi:hypothetical protein